LDGHLELYNKKTNLMHQENEDLKAELQLACKVSEELKMEVEVFEEHVEKMREAENQNLQTIGLLEQDNDVLASENAKMGSVFDPERVRILEEKISEMGLEHRSVEELFDKLIDGFGNSEVGALVREAQNIKIDHNRVRSQISHLKVIFLGFFWKIFRGNCSKMICLSTMGLRVSGSS
jgi:hypothetical protein